MAELNHDFSPQPSPPEYLSLLEEVFNFYTGFKSSGWDLAPDYKQAVNLAEELFKEMQQRENNGQELNKSDIVNFQHKWASIKKSNPRPFG